MEGQQRNSLYRMVFITAAATAGVVVVAMLVLFLSLRQTGAPVAAEDVLTPAVAEAVVAAKVPTRVEYRQDIAFFDPVAGEPAIWYYKKPDGGYDLFDAPGYHPTYGREAPLQAVTSTIVGDIEASFRQSPPARVASTPRRAPARPQAPQAVAAPVAASDPVPAAPVRLAGIIPAGTRLSVVLGRQLSTGNNQVGDTFPVTLAQGVIIGGETVLEQGTRLTGEITALERPGRVSGVAKLTLVLKDANGVAIDTAPLAFQAEATKAEDAAKVGIGGAIGAGIGALFGGKSGAGKGAVVGAGGGAGTVLATRGENLVLEPEQELTFVLSRNATFER